MHEYVSFLSSTQGGETEIEQVLVAYQTNDAILDGRFPVSREDAVELACILAQLEWGDNYTLEVT